VLFDIVNFAENIAAPRGVMQSCRPRPRQHRDCSRTEK